MDTALRALNRFGLGARAGERATLSDPRGWLNAQLEGAAPTFAAPASAAAVGDAFRATRAGAVGSPERRAARQRLLQIEVAGSVAALQQRVVSDRPFVERLVAFWSNHLCISVAGRVQTRTLAASYEREAIRPHVLGRFEDMLVASAQHPAMLYYLDNFQSIGPTAPAVAGRPGGPGLNENHARELLELHTLGVDGGYTQQDVLALARLITGWTVAGGTGLPPRIVQAARAATRGHDQGAMRFMFVPQVHERGEKVILGERYGTGVEEGERALRALARHRSTATFLATRLVTHFVADAPPAAAVTRIARTFLDTGGDLRAVSAALVDLPEAWSTEERKFRTPQDWLVATLRALDQREVTPPLVESLRRLRHTLWGPAAPKGFGDTVQEWADPDSLMNRAELARTIARRAAARRVSPLTLLDVADVADGQLRSLLADASIPADERIALALAGPAFQWR